MRVSQSLLAAILLVAIAVPVDADPETTSRLSWVTNGDVQAAVQVGNTLYIGGTFTRVGPASGALGSFFGVSTITGEPLPLFPLVDGVVHAIEPDGAGGYYIGGAFTSVGGVARTNLARVLVGGTVDPAFAATVAFGPVRSLALGSSVLFVGGSFSSINGTPHQGFATLNPTSGATIGLPPTGFADARSAHRILISGANVIVLSSPSFSPRVLAFDQTTGASIWSTNLTGAVNDTTIAGTRLIVGGRLLQADGRTVASLDLATGAVDPAWIPSGSLPVESSDAVNALAVSGTTLYVGGTFSTFGGEPRANAAAVNISLGTVTPWAPDPNGTISAVTTTLTSTIVLSGTFTQVAGESRETFAEVDAAGSVTPLITDVQAALVQTMRVDVAGNVVAGGMAGVTNAQPRTNLAAFDLSSDTLLPWAPAISDNVTALGAVGSGIYIGASRLVNGPNPSRLGVVSAVDGASGAPVAWTPPASSTNLTLLGTHGSHVYLAGSFPGGSLVRLDAITAAIDPGWRPLVGLVTHMVVSGSTIYLGGSGGLAAVDVATGARSPWAPNLAGAFQFPTITIKGLAVDGRTVHVAFRLRTFMGSVTHQVQAYDAVSGLRTGPLGFASGTGLPEALAVADGQLITARALPPSSEVFFPESVAGVRAVDTNGEATPWDPGYVRVDLSPSESKPGLLVTATDVIVLGYQGTTPVPVQGIAVLPRTPSVAPTSLRATTFDNQVSLAWDAPTPPPAAEYVLDVAATLGSPNPVSLPTGSTATTVNGAAGDGTYYVRVRSSGAPAGPASLSTNEIALVVGCSAAPSSPPLGLGAQVSGSTVTLSWNAPPFSSLSRYVLEAGSSSGATDIATLTFPASQTSVSGDVPPGTYFLRMQTANACGESATSSEIFFTVGSASTIPPAPTGLTANVTGSLVAVQWTPSPGAAGYVVEVGSGPGLANIATLPLSATNFFVNGVPNGIYYLRVRAGSVAGLSAPSSDVVIVVPQ